MVALGGMPMSKYSVFINLLHPGEFPKQWIKAISTEIVPHHIVTENR